MEEKEEEGDSDQDEVGEEMIEEEDEDEDVAFGSLKTVNAEYRSHLTRLLVKLELELARNQERQRQLEEEISSLDTEEEGGPRPDRALGLQIFTAPYFKDQKGFQPPSNIDTKTKTGFSNELSVWLPLQPKKFSEEDQAKLKVSVKQEAVRARTSKLWQEIDRLSLSSSLDSAEVTPPERLADLGKELREVENSAEEVLLAERYERFDWERISRDSPHSATQCRLQWQNKVHPSISNRDFTAEEDKKLQGLAEQFEERSWDTIAMKMESGRTALACFTRYKTHLKTVFNNRPWSKSEDERLAQLVKVCRYNQLVPWQKVAFYMEDRTKEQCSSRFSFALRDNLRKGHFSEVEDLLLVVGIKLHGSDWTRITEIIPCRNSRQLHSRFNYFFKGEKAAWTKEEDEALLKEFKRLGRSDWSRISEELARRGVERNRGQCRRRIQNIWESFLKTEGAITSWGQVLHYQEGPSLGERRQDALRRSLKRHYRQWLEKEGATNTAARTPDETIELTDGVVFSPRGLRLFTRHLQQSLPSKGEKIKRKLPKKSKKFDFMEQSESEEDVDDVAAEESHGDEEED